MFWAQFSIVDTSYIFAKGITEIPFDAHCWKHIFYKNIKTLMVLEIILTPYKADFS